MWIVLDVDVLPAEAWNANTFCFRGELEALDTFSAFRFCWLPDLDVQTRHAPKAKR